MMQNLLTEHKLEHFTKDEALYPETILKVYNVGVGTLGKDVIAALCWKVAKLEEQNDYLNRQLRRP